MSNSWRAIARMARDRLVASNPEEISTILPVCLPSRITYHHYVNPLPLMQLWFLRLSCLARLRLFNQCTAECTNLYSVLFSIEPLSSRNYVFDRLVPFELEVLHARLKYWAGDFVGYLDAMYEMVKKCKLMAKIALEEGEKQRVKQIERERRGGVSMGIGGKNVRGPRGDGGVALAAMWKERGSRMALIIASQFIEMKVCVLFSLLPISLTVCTSLRSLNIRNSRLQHVSWLHSVLHPRPNCVRQWGGYTSKPGSSTRHW